jgi:hypothetical protein
LYRIVYVKNIDSRIYQIAASVNDIQGGVEEFDLLHAWHSGYKEHNTRMNFQLFKAAAKLNGVIGDQNPVFFGHDPQEIPIGRLSQAVVVNVGSLVASGMSRLREANRKVFVHEESWRPHARRLRVTFVLIGFEVRQAGLRGRPRRGCAWT